MTHVVTDSCIRCKAPHPEAERWKDAGNKLAGLDMSPASPN